MRLAAGCQEEVPEGRNRVHEAGLDSLEVHDVPGVVAHAGHGLARRQIDGIAEDDAQVGEAKVLDRAEQSVLMEWNANM